MKRSEQLKAERNKLINEARKVFDLAEKEGRDLTAAEARSFDQKHEAADKLQKEFEAAVEQERQELMAANGGYDVSNLPGTGISLDKSRLDLPVNQLRRGDSPDMAHDLKDAQTGQMIPTLGANDRFSRQPINLGSMLHDHLTGRGLGDVNSLHHTGSFTLDPAQGGAMIDLARSASVCVRAGARTVKMDSAEMQLLAVKKDPAAGWRHPGVDIAVTDMEFGTLYLRPKTLACVIPITVEMMEDSSNIARIITSCLQRSMGLALDHACLFGSGAGGEMLGLSNAPGTNSVATFGTPANYSKITTAIRQILAANYGDSPDGLAWIMPPRDWASFDDLVDDIKQPLQPTPWASKLSRLSTTSLPTNLGAGTNESVGFIGDFSQMIIGMRTNGINIRVLDSGTVTDAQGVVHNAAGQLKKLIVAYLRADVGIIRPTWFTKLSGITAAA